MPPFFDRFWPKVRENLLTGCWVWTGTRLRKGYGKFKVGGRMVYAHRLAFRQLVGPIPPWLEVDHSCRNRTCVNPAHLELVTHHENIRRGVGIGWNGGAHNRRKTHCPQGHPYDEENTYIWRGTRYCRACRRYGGTF